MEWVSLVSMGSVCKSTKAVFDRFRQFFKENEEKFSELVSITSFDCAGRTDQNNIMAGLFFGEIR